MNSFSVLSFTHRCFAAIMLIALISCGGGGGGDGTTTSTATFGNTTAGIGQLTNTFAATLSGAEATPPTPSNAQGSGNIVVDPVTRIAVITLVTSNITSVTTGTSATINDGATGTVGPVVFPLTETSLGSGFWTARVVLTAAQLSLLQSSAYYFNVQSTAFPNGEIRGQILPQSTPPGTTVPVSNTLSVTSTVPNSFISALKGSQEIPSNSSTALGSGAVVITAGTNIVRAAVTTSGIAGTAANIQTGAVGSPGIVTLTMDEAVAGSGIWIIQATLNDSQLSALSNGNLFFNVGSAAFPSGEIRGQILPVLQSLVGASSLTTFSNTPTTTTGAIITPTFNGTNITGTTGFGNGSTGTTFTGTGVTGTNITGTGTNITSTGTNITSTGNVGGANITGIGSTTTTGIGTPVSTGVITTGM